MPLVYTAKSYGKELTYELNESQLTLQTDDAVKVQFDLKSPSLRVRPKTEMHRFFWAGVVLLVFPVWTCSMIVWKEGWAALQGVSIGNILCLIGFIAGAFLVYRYMRPVRGLFIVGEEIGIYVIRDASKQHEYETFTKKIREISTQSST